MDNLWLVPLGFGVGVLGTLVGAGGGFVLVPVLLLLYPHERPETIASISLAVVFFNALSGTYAYSRMKRVDYKSGFLLSAATVPGAILGAVTTSLLPRRTFDVIFAVVLLLASAFLVWKPHARVTVGRGKFHRVVTDHEGVTHEFSYNPWVAAGLSLVVGYLSSLLGIGGGIIHVPVLTMMLGFPVHIATATSHFALAVMAGAGSLTHLATGALHDALGRVLFLSVGVIVGAQLGAQLSTRIHGNWILRTLSLALAAVAIRLLIG